MRLLNMKNVEISFVNLLILLATCYINNKLPNSKLILGFGFALIVINSLRYFFEIQLKKVLDFIIQYRWPIALILFILLVTFRIHGSSVGVYNSIYPIEDSSVVSELFGTSRPIRGDEFNVQLPYYFSQFYNDYKQISYQMSLAGQDMILGYNAPVIGLTLIGKPFVWGYILFGNEIGLSWYWCSKTILFILVSFEMLNVLTRNKYFSLFGALFIVFSPSMQWWFSPHMYDVFFWATSLFLVGYYFFMAKSNTKKWLFTLLAISCLTGFVIALFPSLQIPTGLLMLALLIVCIVRDREEFSFKKSDICRIFVVVIGIGIVLGQFLLSAKDQIDLLYNTVYPGARISTGGDSSFADLFTDINMALTPFITPEGTNQCEMSTFNHLGPFFLFLYPILFYNNKRKIKENISVGSCLFIVLCIEIFFMLVGFPTWLSKVTLFSYINRMKIVYGFTATIFTVWSMNYVIKNIEKLPLIPCVLVCVLFLCCYIFVGQQMINSAYFQYKNEGYYIIVPLGFGIVSFLLFTKYAKFVYGPLLIWMVVTSFTVNPIARGISAITNHKISDVVSSLVNKEDGYWIATDSTYAQEFLLANGAKVLNGVNFYPDYGKWKVVDSKGTFDDIYNRYAHIQVHIIEGPSEYFLNAPDNFQWNLSVDDLSKLNVSYLLTREDLSVLLQSHDIKYEVEFYDETTQDTIYKLGV